MPFQKWPEERKIHDNMNKTLSELRKILDNEGGTIHNYVIKSIVNKPGDTSNTFYQDGCTPNFEGGLLTYTACRLDLQARNKKEDWEGQWIAGYTSKQRHGDYYLVFLMKVSKAFDSFKDIWESLDPNVRSVKNSRYNYLGDLYEPKFKDLDNKWNSQNYYAPVNGHSHLKENRWYKDINYYHKTWKRRACQLVGDPDKSYLWNEPSIKRCQSFTSPKNAKKDDDMKDLLKNLCSS